MKALFAFLRNALLGGIGIVACNIALGNLFIDAGKMAVGLNFLTVGLVGVLGVPGLALLYVAQLLIN